MLIDLSPLKNNKEFRYLYFGQFISFFGTMLSIVALPYQVYQMTKSTFAVGMLGIVELVPLLLTAFIGGALSDIMDRKTLLIRAEIGMAVCCSFLLFNAMLDQPHLWLIFVVAALMSAFNGLHRPSLDAMIPRLVQKHEIQATSVLAMFKSVSGMIGGPAVAGLCIAQFGLVWTYALDLVTFIFSIVALSFLSPKPHLGDKERPSMKSVIEALRYAYSRQELMGTYLIDFIAMVFAMPQALFPALADLLGGTKTLGLLYAAPAMGALVIMLFSGWTKNIRHHGAAVGIAAICWGAAIVGFGFSMSIFYTLFFLILAGAADGVSGIFRTTIWNETIPDRIRGRMASLEMISYTSGPLLGNAQAGLMSSIVGLNNAIVLGGSLCIIGVILSIFILPRFWRYQKNSVPL
jgi:MFS family permease